jgi:hypothetical protein
MQVVEQISDLLRGKRLNQLPGVLWVRVQNEPIYAPEHIDQLRQFTSVLTVTYRTTRPGTATS